MCPSPCPRAATRWVQGARPTAFRLPESFGVSALPLRRPLSACGLSRGLLSGIHCANHINVALRLPTRQLQASGPPTGCPTPSRALHCAVVTVPTDTSPGHPRPRIFSGVQPSGLLHIGNYLGAIRNWVRLQEEYDCVYCVVDLHAITVRQTRKELQASTFEVANTFLAAGIDPQRSIVLVQSHVPAHSELAWILNTVTYMGELRRMTQFKDKTGGSESESIGVGLFDYPVLMAADILLYRADAVPVGEDQKQHVELTRDVAERFNNAFGKAFVIPHPLIFAEGARVMGLDDPTKKMSKSASSAANYIALSDGPDVIRRKIQRAVTDSGTDVRAGEDKPALTNLLTIYSLLSGESIAQLEERYTGKGYADFKRDLADVVVESLAPFQKRLAELQSDRAYTLGVLKEGAERAEAIATRTLAKVRERVGLVPRPT
jgi:tryptophanyl-tRNA synthetase